MAGTKWFPKKLYLVREKDPNSKEVYFVSFEDLADLKDKHGEVVGIYELSEQKRVQVKVDIKGK